MAGVTLPASMSSVSDDAGPRRSPIDDEHPQLLARRTARARAPGASGRSRRATVRRVSPPTMTSVPRGVRARRSSRQRPVAADVEDDVVALPAAGEVLAGVVDDVVGAEGADQVHLRRAAHAGDLGAERLGDLHGERADAARRADDQHLLPGLDPSLVAQACSAVQAGDRDGGRLLEA